ncbi:MAG: nucleotidyltransferase family protein [Thiobacillaceae bacterium]
MGCPLKSGGGLYARLAIGAILLAAGKAERLGGRPKPLLHLGGVPLIRRQLIALSGAGVDEVAVVTGHQAEAVEAVVQAFPLTVVHNADYDKGQMTSVRAGLKALSDKLDAIIIALADQPLLVAEDFTALIAAYKKRESGSVLVLPYVRGQRGNPIVIDAAIRDEILAGDIRFGCRQWIAQHPERIARMESDNLHYMVDLDTPEDLERFHNQYGHALAWPEDLADDSTADRYSGAHHA